MANISKLNEYNICHMIFIFGTTINEKRFILQAFNGAHPSSLAPEIFIT